MKLEKEDTGQVAEDHLDDLIMASERVTESQVKFVYRKMIDLDEDNDQSGMTNDMVWEFIQKNTKRGESGAVKNIDQMKKAILELEEKGKVMISDEDQIYLM